MDYQAAFLVAFFLSSLVLVWTMLKGRNTPAREERRNRKHETAWQQIDVSYATFGLIFLAFDMEMIFMFPWAVAYKSVGMTAFWDMLVFAVILIVGLVYAGKRGAFRL